jgi:hypothetical protein
MIPTQTTVALATVTRIACCNQLSLKLYTGFYNPGKFSLNFFFYLPTNVSALFSKRPLRLEQSRVS